MPDDLLARMLVSLGIVLALMGAVVWVIKQYGSKLGLQGMIRQGKPRLQLLEVTALDARHRMVLVRRDNVEHVVIVGGTQPVVVEAGLVVKE